jgi:transcriptional regulator with XRE-family HTH domain
MDIGDRLRELREAKEFSQGEIEKRTGLLRCYISRVENGHTIPSIETLGKMARALEIPLYALFYDGSEEPPELPDRASVKEDWASRGRGARYFAKLRQALSRAREDDRRLLMHLVQKMTS